MSEVSNIKENKSVYLTNIILRARMLAPNLKYLPWVKFHQCRDLIQDIIIYSHCLMSMSHMSTGDLEEIVKTTLEYFKTGLHDTDKISLYERADGLSFDVRAWVYTPLTHKDAGEWFYIYDFEKSEDAQKCIQMLKEIEAELKKLY